ncbi:hypothetical protein CKO28_03070 [Rhodovibrio sodomensis]|uniref:Uncharacterized protein n=1 Tax=Rhodovibrio sodomensis TaxID=1088 RepID=A0ABS1DCA3_9PROT|nr:hypothetical protein [Rhodovibrio sodomensis]MBK1667025.1 hypothetical protein [Rhodovibrio sodomensis]
MPPFADLITGTASETLRREALAQAECDRHRDPDVRATDTPVDTMAARTTNAYAALRDRLEASCGPRSGAGEDAVKASVLLAARMLAETSDADRIERLVSTVQLFATELHKLPADQRDAAFRRLAGQWLGLV